MDSGPTTRRAGRLRARFGAPSPLTAPVGASPLGLGGKRDGVLWVPRSVGPSSPLLVALHGAAGRGRQMVGLLRDRAEERGVLVLAPDARWASWDLVATGGFGADTAFLDEALALVGRSCPVDARRVGICGFSDGASYALSLGLGNGDLFGHVMAYSPGFSSPPRRVGLPRLFVSHGEHDQVLPVGVCSRRLVPALREAGYEVRYEEFPGDHRVPAGVVTESMRWFLD